MFKGVVNFLKSKNGKWVLVIIVVLLIIWALSSYSSSKRGVVDNMYSSAGPAMASQSMGQSSANSLPPLSAASVNASSAPVSTGSSGSAMPTASSCSGGYNLAPVADPASLLPSDPNASQWAALNPSNMTNPMIPSLLQAGGLIGLDTIGQTLKNANLQLRSDPLIVKQSLSPWNNSTYEPNIGQVPLELGCGAP